MMKQILFLLVVILLLSGCTVEPAALALIPTPALISTPVPDPPYQPCEPDREEVFYMIYDGSGSEIIVYCGDLSVDDRWLRAWAKDAIARDDASRMMKFWEAGSRTDGATAFYMNFFLEADRSCLEDRGELARLIETNAEEYRSREHIDFPLLAAANVLRSDVTATGEYTRATNQDESPVAKVDCSEKFAALSATPDPPPLCFASDEDEVGECFNVAPGSISTSASNQCNTEEAMIAPGQTVTDEVSDELAAHIDITQVSTALSGETLTVVFHLRDVPKSLTFNRKGIEEGYVEYMWEVSIDLDNNQETGFGGFEHTLSALYYVQPGESGSNKAVPIEDKAHANTWKVGPDGGTSSLFSASMNVSVDAGTITLTGDVPGITADSRLAFMARDYLGGIDMVGCHNWQSPGTAPVECDSDEAIIMPGQTVTVDTSHALAAHIDITGVSTTLSGETLTAVFQLKDVPESLTFNRTGMQASVLEYSWEVSIDIDDSRETGDSGIDYTLSARYFVPPSESGGDVVETIESKVEANTWERYRDGSRSLDDAGIEVSTQANTITLVGDIPGITAESRLVFEAYDFLSGSDEVACQVISTGGQ